MVSEREISPSVKHEPAMHKKGARSKFMSGRVKYYMSQGMNYLVACRTANGDYSKFCGQKKSPIAYVEFPALANVKEELIPILKV
jgi:hypothetical protein